MRGYVFALVGWGLDVCLLRVQLAEKRDVVLKRLRVLEPRRGRLVDVREVVLVVHGLPVLVVVDVVILSREDSGPGENSEGL